MLEQGGRGQGGAREILVAIGRDHDRVVGKDLEVDGERAHRVPNLADPGRVKQGGCRRDGRAPLAS
jgi:hypothetical protein